MFENHVKVPGCSGGVGCGLREGRVGSAGRVRSKVSPKDFLVELSIKYKG